MFVSIPCWFALRKTPLIYLHAAGQSHNQPTKDVMLNVISCDEKLRNVAEAVKMPIAAFWHRIGKIWMGHGPKRTVFRNPDLMFRMSGLKLAEHEPEWRRFFA